jgi:hypothetical protein
MTLSTRENYRTAEGRVLRGQLSRYLVRSSTVERPDVRSGADGRLFGAENSSCLVAPGSFADRREGMPVGNATTC